MEIAQRFSEIESDVRNGLAEGVRWVDGDSFFSVCSFSFGLVICYNSFRFTTVLKGFPSPELY